MSRDDKIDWFLEFYVIRNFHVNFWEACEVFDKEIQPEDTLTDPKNYNNTLFILNKMISEELLEEHETERYSMKISLHGQEVSEQGGWVKHRNERASSDQLAEDDKQLQRDLAKSNIEVAKSNIEANKINKRNQKRNFWILITGLFLTLTGAVLSILNYIWLVRN